MREYVLTLLVTAAVTDVLTPLVRRIAIRGGVLHAARDRDVHVVPIPLMGGLAMYAGLAAGLIAASVMVPLNTVFLDSRMESGLLLAGGLIVAIVSLLPLNYFTRRKDKLQSRLDNVATDVELLVDKSRASLV